MNKSTFSPEQKLTFLQAAGGVLSWKTLDDECTCLFCDHRFKARKAHFRRDHREVIHIGCPTVGCPGTPTEWVHPGNPLLCREAWKDWARVLDEIHPLRAVGS